MLEDIRLAFQGIWSHKLRSALTMLGIIIGIGSIMQLFQRSKEPMSRSRKIWLAREIMRSISSFIRETGHWICLIRRFRMEYRRFSDQVLGEIQALDEVESAALYHRRNEYDADMQAVRSWQAVIFFGIDSNYLDAYGFQITKGRGFFRKRLTANRKVVLLDKRQPQLYFRMEM